MFLLKIIQIYGTLLTFCVMERVNTKIRCYSYYIETNTKEMLTIIFVVVCLEYLNKKRRWQLFKVNRIETRYVCGASAILFGDGVILLVFAGVIARLQRFCKIHTNHSSQSVKIAFFVYC